MSSFLAEEFPSSAQECQLLGIALEARLRSDCVSAHVLGRALGTVLHVLLVSDTAISAINAITGFTAVNGHQCH